MLGSGWGPAADLLGRTETEIVATDLPGFSAPAVAGHKGVVRSVSIGDSGRRALVLPRTHLYEGKGVRSVVHGVRTAAAAGCSVIVFTNGCGGLNRDWTPGTPVLIRDHLNLTGVSPIEGAEFVDLTDLYSPRLRDLCRQVEPDLAEGVYAQFRGPQYETPAEVRMAGVLGADLVGMSTAIEAIAARQSGLEVLGPVPGHQPGRGDQRPAAEPRGGARGGAGRGRAVRPDAGRGRAVRCEPDRRRTPGSNSCCRAAEEWRDDDPDPATRAELGPGDRRRSGRGRGGAGRSGRPVHRAAGVRHRRAARRAGRRAAPDEPRRS